MSEQHGSSGADPARGFDHDILAERRARRAAEMSDSGLLRRAEVAEATVSTLETHLANLQERLRETTDRQQRLAEELIQREDALREVKQREYSEQQLRVEAEERYEELQHEKQAEIDELRHRLGMGDRHLRELSDQLEAVRAELVQAEHVAGAERASAQESQRLLADREAELARRELAVGRDRAELEERLRAAREAERSASTRHGESEERREMLMERLLALEARATEIEREVEVHRAARERSEYRLLQAHERYAALERTIGDLGRTAAELRGAIEQERGLLQSKLDRQREELSREQELALRRERERLDGEHREELVRMRTRVEELEGELRLTAEQLSSRSGGEPAAFVPQAAVVAPAESSEGEDVRRREMSDALAAAVERLRTRALDAERNGLAQEPALPAAAATSPAEAQPQVGPASTESPAAEQAPAPVEPQPEPPRAEAIAGTVVEAVAQEPASSQPAAHAPPAKGGPRAIASMGEQEPWLAPAIRRVAERRDAKLAGELVVELMPAQRLVVSDSLKYAIEIDGLGSFIIGLGGEGAAVERITSPEQTGKGKVDFTLKGSAQAFSELAAGGAGRRLTGVKVRGKRRRLRKLLAARHEPMALGELARAGIRVWPGLLLLAMAEAIDPAWTTGQSFAIAFVIEDKQSATIYVCVRDGEPLVVTRVHDEEPRVTVSSDELAFLSLLSGLTRTDSAEITVHGSREALEQFIGWVDRAQGLQAVS